MIQEAISPLRQRMIEDLTIRNFASETQRNYVRAAKTLAVFLAGEGRERNHPHRLGMVPRDGFRQNHTKSQTITIIA
jgi:hypothetical protein